MAEAKYGYIITNPTVPVTIDVAAGESNGEPGTPVDDEE